MVFSVRPRSCPPWWKISRAHRNTVLEYPVQLFCPKRSGIVYTGIYILCQLSCSPRTQSDSRKHVCVRRLTKLLPSTKNGLSMYVSFTTQQKFLPVIVSATTAISQLFSSQGFGVHGRAKHNPVFFLFAQISKLYR